MTKQEFAERCYEVMRDLGKEEAIDYLASAIEYRERIHAPQAGSQPMTREPDGWMVCLEGGSHDFDDCYRDRVDALEQARWADTERLPYPIRPIYLGEPEGPREAD